MKGREAVITALKAMNKPLEWGSLDSAHIYATSLWSENDRGVIILSGSAIEELLEREIRKLMPQLNSDERSYLFDFNGPIGTFSSKIRMANALGIISRQIYRKIDLIREMRNSCAHSRQPLTFQSPPIFDAVVCLVHDLRMTLPAREDNDGTRKTFVTACLLIMMVALQMPIEEAHKQLRETLAKHKPSPDTPAE